MAVTRIKNNQITDSTITGSKLVNKTVTGGLLSDDLTYSSNLTVSGNLTVNGTTTTVDTSNTVIADPLLVLSRGETGTPSADSGFVVERGSSTNVGFVWDESADQFAAINTSDDGSTAGNLTISSYADIKVGAATLTGNLGLGNLLLSGNDISSTNTNGNVTITPNGTGDIGLAADTIIAGDSGANATITTNGAGDLILNTNSGTNSGSVTIADGVNGTITLAPNGTGTIVVSNLVDSDLTATRIVLAGTAGAIEDSASLTFDGTTFEVGTAFDVTSANGNVLTTGTLGAGETTLSSATISDLTSGRVVLAGTSGAIADSGNLTFNGSTLAVTGAATVSSTLGVTGESTLASATISDLTSSRVVLAGTAGAIEDDANFTFDGTELAVGVTNFTVQHATGDTVVGGTLGAGESTLSSATISDLTSGRVVLAGTAGAVEDSANLTFNGSTLAVTGAATISTTLGVTGESTLASATISDVTATHVMFAGTAGAVTGNANLTWSGTTLAVTGAATVSTTLGVTGESTLASATISDVTATHVMFAGTAGAVTGNANLTWSGTVFEVGTAFDVTAANGNTLIGGTLGAGETTLSSATISDVTATHVMFAGTAGAVEGSANLVWSAGILDVTGAVKVDNITINGDTISSAHTTLTIDPSSAGAGGTVVIAGNLTVQGTTTTIDSTVVTIADPVFQIGADSTDNLDRGITALYNDGASKVAFFGMDDSAIEFVFIPDATDTSSLFSGTLGKAAFGSMRVTDLTNGRLVLAGTSGELEDSGNLTFNGSTLAVTGAATISTTLGVTGESTLASATVSDLTSGRVVLAGTAGALQDNGNLTFDGTTLTATGAITATGTVTGGTLTDGTVVINAGTITGITSLTASGAIQGGSLTDGTATLSSGALTGATSGAFSTNVTVGGTLGVTGVTSADGGIEVRNTDNDGEAFTIAAGTGNTVIGGTLGVTGESTLASATISDVTATHIMFAGTAGAVEGSSSLTWSGTVFEVGTAFDVTAANGNTLIGGTLGAGETTLSSATISDLTATRVVLAGTSGAIEDSGNLTFNGSTLAVTGAATISSTLGVTGESTLASATISDLTSGRVVLAGTSGAIEDSGNLTFNGSTLAVTGAATISSTLGVTGESTLASATISDVTATHVMFAGTAGAVEGSANLTWSGTTLAVTGGATISTTLGVTGESTLASATVSDLTATRITFAGTAGALEDSANLTFNGTTLTVAGAAAIDNVGINGNSITGTGDLILEATAASSIVLNEAGADVDVRIESSGSANSLFVEGSTGNIGIKTATPNAQAALTISGNNSIIVPSGTTGERPNTPATAMTRFNTSNSLLEFYDGTQWVNAGSNFTVIIVDDFAGDGSTVAFTLSQASTSASVIISLNGVVQDPGTAYSVSGTTLTFTEAPATGDNIDVRLLTTTQSVRGIADLNTSIDVDDTAETITMAVDGSTIMTVNGTSVIPGANVTYDLGSASLRWKDLYLSGTTIALGDIKLKDNGSGVLGIFAADGTTPATISSSSIDTTTIANGTSNVSAANNADVTVTVAGATAATFSSTGLTLAGNLTVNGTTTTINSTTLTVDDINMVLASGAANGAAADGAGITVDGAAASILYANTGDKWVFNKPGDFGANNVTATTFVGALTGTASAATLAADATKLATTRAIEVSGAVTGTANFDGSAAINIVTTATSDPTITLGGDLTGSVTLTNLASGTLTATVGTLNQNTTGSAATLTTTRAIQVSGAVTGTANFDGSAAINIVTTNTADPTITLGGDLSGAVTLTNLASGTLTATVGTLNQNTTGSAATLTTARAIALSGDVTGTVNFDGSAGVTISTTIAANSVALGTDTTGNYVGAGAVSGVGLSGSLAAEGGTFTVTSNATSANTASTIVARDGSGNFSAGTITATSTSAQYADLAEMYAADADIEAGTVVHFVGEGKVAACDAVNCRSVAGIISTDPAHLMNVNQAGVALALAGRVPTKVSGAVKAGDLMVSAGNGRAMANNEASIGTVIGKALEDHEGGDGVIEVLALMM